MAVSRFVIVSQVDNKNFYFTKNEDWSDKPEEALPIKSQSKALKILMDINVKKMLGLPKIGRRSFEKINSYK